MRALDARHVEELRGPDLNSAGADVDIGHVPRSAILRRHTKPKASALTDREGEGTRMSAQRGTSGRIDEFSWALPQFAREETGSVAVWNEADVVTVGLAGHEQAALLRFRTNGLLGVVAEREERTRQLLPIKYAEHIGLILCRIDRSMQFRAISARKSSTTLSRNSADRSQT
jgi:hypothetical protein